MTAQTETPRQAPAEPSGRRWHYVMSLQWRSDTGSAAVTNSGTYAGVVTPRPGVTRAGLFRWALETSQAAMGVDGETMVVFASIEPDELS
jgi:hypothetical protein